MGRRRRQGSPTGLMGTPVATFPWTAINGAPSPLFGVSVTQQFFGLSQLKAFEQAVGVKTNVMLAYQQLCEAWPSAYSTVVATGRVPEIAFSPSTAQVAISGGVRNSDGGVDSPMVTGTVYKGVVVSALTSFIGTQPAGSIMQVGGESSGPFCTTQTAITSSSVGTQILTTIFTAVAAYSLAAVLDQPGIVAGNYDSTIQQIARYAAGSAIMRFASEMNEGSYSWGIASSGSGFTASQYIAMWDHVRSVWRAQETSSGYSHCPWLWDPNVSGGGTYPFSSCYPGDSECEFVGLDGYSYSNDGNPSFSSLFSADITTLEGLSVHNIIIGETGCSAYNPARAVWFTDMFSYLKANSNVIGFSYFDHPDTYEDFLDNDPAGCAAFRAGLLYWAG
jgi:hypothetical protein